MRTFLPANKASLLAIAMLAYIESGLSYAKGGMHMKLLNLREAADILGLKVSTIRAWTLRRKIEFVKVGRCVRIRQEIIDELIAKNTIPKRPA